MPDPTTRRQWLRTTARRTLLGGLTVLTGTLVVRRVTAGKERCERTIACEACASLGGCSFPQAIDARKKESSHAR